MAVPIDSRLIRGYRHSVLLAGMVLAMAPLLQAAIPITPEHAELLQQAILEAYDSGQRHIVIPPGTYNIPPRPQGFHLQFEKLADLEIDARGANLVFADQSQGGIDFRDCRNFRFRGASIRYAIPPFTQGVIEAIAPDGSWYDVRIEPGYPTNLDNPKYFPAAAVGFLFDPDTRLWKPGTYDLNGSRIERLTGDSFRVFWIRPFGPDVHPVAVRDLIAFRGTGPHNITVLHSEKVDITGVTIYNAPNFAVWEFEGEGANHYTISVKRGPRPAGARTDPLLSSTADAFHSTNVRQGPVLEDCDFSGMGDDGIAIQGTFSFVLQATGSRLVINNNSFRPGDPVRLLDPIGRLAGDGKVKSIRPLPAFRQSRKSRRVTRVDTTQGPYTEITLDRQLAAGFDYLASNPAASGSGYIIRRNRIHDHRARGMLLKAENGLVEDNILDGSTMGGIVLSPELWWNEASFSRRVVLRHNTIRRVAYAPNQLAAVIVGTTEGTPGEGCGHREIAIEENRFENLNGVNILITTACDVIVKNNQFLHPQWASREGSQSLILVTQARRVRIEGNTVSDPGPFYTKMIQSTPTAQGQAPKSRRDP